MEEKRKIKIGIYRHFKGVEKLYEVLGIAKHTETEEELVIYKALYNDDKVKQGMIFARPINMFLEEVPKEKENPTGQKYRFEYVEESKDCSF